METRDPSTDDAALQGPTSRRLRWPSRTFMVLLPLHLIAFALLYLGSMRIVRGEILRTHTHDAKVILQEAVQDLHPLMVSHDGRDAQARLESFLLAHELLELRLYGPDAVLLGNRSAGGPVEPEIASFVASGQREQFRFEREGRILALHGLTRLDSETACRECHPHDAVLGVASMRLDMTPQVAAAHDRMSRHLGLLIIAWGVLVALTTSVGTRVARRSVERLRSGMASGTGSGADPGVGALLLDPASARLYESLREVLQRQQRRDVEVASRLHHAQRLASLGQLAAGLAHEIKNPLAGIHGVLELLRDEEDDTEKARLFREMLAELDRVNGTIHTLLAFARPSPPRRTSTAVAELVDGIAKLLRPGLARQGIELVTAVVPPGLTFALDPDQIRQVLVNLVSNAAEAIEREGTVAIRATTLPDGAGLLLAVEDDGPGINEDELHAVFEPFYSTKFSGTGLGLAVARSLVAQHGGELQVTSRVGRGSTFLAVLPSPDRNDDAAAEAEGG